jgi:hypothetical protein
MLGGPSHFSILLGEFGSGSLALGALFRGLFTFPNKTANLTYPFHKYIPPFLLIIYAAAYGVYVQINHTIGLNVWEY